MQWRGRRQSGNVDDQRGSGGGGGFGGLPIKGGIGIVIVIVVIGLITGQNPLSLLQQIPMESGPSVSQSTPYQSTPEEQELVDLVGVVLADTEEVWNKLLDDYREPRLTIFNGTVQSGCGNADASTGPFYCSADERVYIDLSFYEDLKSRFNAPGDFAQAYVIAHEVGHHVQYLMGITGKVHEMKGQISEAEYNKLSVKLELQADFLAGVWAHHADDMFNIIEAGDFDEAMNAASAIGDDRLQKQARGYVVPDSFTHGTSAQRQSWFRKGYETGDINQGDTFNATNL
ncbi:MAG: neutral zinc metallopeptidase [Flammeovirgaceae bacterium]|nr:neutral zinc metallopeptidase [Flammeovirgaceae bacterium]